MAKIKVKPKKKASKRTNLSFVTRAKTLGKGLLMAHPKKKAGTMKSKDLKQKSRNKLMDLLNPKK